MTLYDYDLGRSLLIAGALLLACAPVPSEVETGPSGGPGDTGDTGDTTMGPISGTADDTSDATMGGTDETGPSFDPICGDGLVEAPEECDLGPLNGSGMYCTNDCASNVCGDGYLGPGEGCDDGNLSNDDLCTSECGPTSCGDGALQGMEQCDDGENNAENAGCLPSCQLATCGDLFIHQGVETCDGSNDAGESCASQGFDRGVLLCATDCLSFDTSNCHECGNGVIEPNEDCDGSVYMDDVTCTDYAPGGTTVSGGALACTMGCTTIDSSDCTYCGDGVREGTENCDTNQFGPNTCATFAPGGTTVSGGMLSCTNGCAINSDACTYCGDDNQEGTEVCDGTDVSAETCVSQGFVSGPLGCAANCMAYDFSACETCGDGVADPGEECDGADLNGGDCATAEGPGNIGPLTCDGGCNYDITACCLDDDEPCGSNAQCCSGDCSTTCQPL